MSTSNEQDLDDTGQSHKRNRKLTSIVWDEFERIIDSDGKESVKCKRCNQIYAAGYGTTNMKRHVDKCPNRAISGSATSHGLSPLDQEKYRKMVAKAIILHGLAFSFVQYVGIRDLHSFLNPEVKAISRNTARSDVLKVYRAERENLKQSFQLIPSRFCFTSDLWTSPTSDYYMTLTAHYVDQNWELQNKILSFSHVPPPYNATLLAEKLFNLLKEWGVEKRIFTITLDNASYNDSMVNLLKQCYLGDSLVCGGEFFHIRCGAHVLNLIVQQGLKVIENCLHKIRESVKYVKSPPTRKKRFAECIAQSCSTNVKKIQQDVSTRWNSTYEMLEGAITFRRAFEHLAMIDSNFRTCPSEEEWAQLGRICKFLKPFYEITKLFSGSNYPTSNLYFPLVWKIQSLLLEEMRSDDLQLSVMAHEMKVKFDKYWKCYSLVLSFAMIMDPRFKLQYVEFAFEKLNAPSDQIIHIRDKLYELFEEYMFSSSDAAMAGVGSSAVDDSLDSDVDDPNLREFDRFQSRLFGMSKTKSQLDEYLEESRLNRKKNPHLNVLSYWERESSKHPDLARMARDILTIPITSVASESAFSVASRMLSKYRNCLHPQNAEAQLCAQNWLHGVSPMEDFEEELLVDFEDMNVVGIPID